MKLQVGLLWFVFLVAGCSHAAVCEGKNHSGVTALYLSQSIKPDSAAEQWVSDFREQIQGSDPYCLVSDKDKAVMVVNVVGMDADLSKNSTAISIAIYTAKGSIFLDHWMYVAAKENLQSSSEKAFASLQKEIQELKRLRLIK